MPEGHAHPENAGEFYACPMFCTRSDSPGECPVCGMTLEKFEDTGDSLPLDERQRRALGILSEPIQQRMLAREVRSYGEFRPDESRDQIVSAWIDGRIERMYADYTGVKVEAGWHLFDLYSPDLYSAQQELLLALKSLEAPGAPESMQAGNQRLVTMARTKLELLGLGKAQIAEIELQREPQLTQRIDSPATGTVLERHGFPGMYVERGMPLYRIADLSTLWLIAEVHESHLPWVALGQQADVRVTSMPDRVFSGRVGFIEPALTEASRTARVRIELPNPDGLLRLGMFATAVIFAELTEDAGLARPVLEGGYACPMHPLERAAEPGGACPICGMEQIASPPPASAKAGAVTAIPRSAVISTGRRHLVYVETLPGTSAAKAFDQGWVPGQASYTAFEVHLGPLASEWHVLPDGTRQKLGDYYPVLHSHPAAMSTGGMALSVGITRVVTNGQFLIDSQLELTGKPSLVLPAGGSGAAADPHAGHR